MKAPPIAPKITLGYVGGADPFIAAIETVWPEMRLLPGAVMRSGAVSVPPPA